MRRLAPFVPLGVAIVVAGWALGLVGLPSAYLFAALLVGVAAALAWPGVERPPRLAFGAAQAVAGTALGTSVTSSSLSSLSSNWLPVALVSLATLAASVGAGVVLSRTTSLDRPTGTLGMVAGGASGIVAMADELGADDRLVAFMQYLRVLIVVVLTPVLVGLAFSDHHGGPAPTADDPLLGDARGWLLAIGIAAVGVVAGRVVRLSAGTLLGPMILAALVVLVVPGGDFEVPPLLVETSFALIGLQVGLAFTLETMREVGRLLLPVSAAILGLIAVSFGFAVALAATTSVPLFDAYLATTPGGLYAVIAIAVGAGADSTFVLAVQTLRLFVMILLAPMVVRWVSGQRVSAGRFSL